MTLFPSRRRFLEGLAAGAALFTSPGLFAQELSRTATTTEGPFYPDRLPLDTDNDLLLLNDAMTPGVGEITHLAGRVLTESGLPLGGAFVEIWQVDSTGSYVHTGGRQPTGNDSNFQGYGRFLTDSEGRYYFRTIRPIEYTLLGIFRAPHIHVAISRNGQRILTTQLLERGHPANARDSVIRQLDARDLDTLLVDFAPLAGSTLGELTARFDLVLGRTAAESESGQLGGIGPSENQRR